MSLIKTNVALAFACVALRCHAATAPQPNIIVILADDLGYAPRLVRIAWRLEMITIRCNQPSK